MKTVDGTETKKNRFSGNRPEKRLLISETKTCEVLKTSQV